MAVTSSSSPVATAMTRSYASSLVSVRRTPLMAQNAIVAASARRLFPSISAWFRASECSSAAAFS
jgi:hypothetical protein